MTDEGFSVNMKKTHVIRAGNVQEVTGLLVNGQHAPRVSRTKKRQMRAAIHNLQQQKPLPEGESRERLMGYAAFIAMTDRPLGQQMIHALMAL
jgi:heme A synthase